MKRKRNEKGQFIKQEEINYTRRAFADIFDQENIKTFIKFLLILLGFLTLLLIAYNRSSIFGELMGQFESAIKAKTEKSQKTEQKKDSL
jgi:hypothetical protein